MKLHFVAANPKLGPMRKSIGLADGSSRTYPMAYSLTSGEEEMDVEQGVKAYRELLLKHASQGHALYKGLFTKELVNESRRGLTDKEAKTQFMVLDIDGLSFEDYKAGPCTAKTVKDIAERVIALMPTALQNVSYVAVGSSSFGLKDKEVSVHIHFLLKDAVKSRALKKYLQALNYTQVEIYSKLKLTPSRMRLKSIVDPCLAEPSRLIYITPPHFGPKGKNPFKNDSDRIVAVDKKQPLLDLRAEFMRMAELDAYVEGQQTSKLSDLQKKAGVDTKKLKTTRIKVGGGDVTVVTNPPPCQLEFAYADEEFIRYNIAGKYNNAYWVKRSNPEIVYCFVPDEPAFLFRVADPEGYARHVDKYGEAYEVVREEESNIVRKISRNMAIDQTTDTFITFEYDIENDQLIELKDRKTEYIAQQWMKHYGQVVPDPVPAVHVVNNPDRMEVTYNEGPKMFINRFKPTVYMMDKTDYTFPEEARYGNAWLLSLNCPVISEIILHMLGDDMECFEHFINWLAFIMQNKNKAETSWMVQGTEGTGKGLFFKRVLRPLFGQEYTAQNTLQKIADDQFNGWMEDLFVLMVDEFNMKGATGGITKTAAMLKNLITEPTIMIRKMNQQQREIIQRISVIFATNDLDAMSIPDKRRHNIAPRQQRDLEMRLEYIKRCRDETDELIHRELLSFSRFLKTFRVNRRLVGTILENQARVDSQKAGMNAVDKFFEHLRLGEFEAFAGILDKPAANIDPVEQVKLARAKKFLTDNLEHVNTNKACYLHKDDIKALYSFLAGKDTSDNAFGRMLNSHELNIKRRSKPVGYIKSMATRPECVEVIWKYPDEKALEQLKKNFVPITGGNVASIDSANDEEAKRRRLQESLKHLGRD